MPAVIPAKAGIQDPWLAVWAFVMLDSRLRGNDGGAQAK